MNILARFQQHRTDAKLKKSLLDAASDGDATAVLALLAGGLDVNADLNGLTAVQAAAMEGHANLVRALIERGANANAADPEHGITTLMQAAESGNLDTVQLLLQAGANATQRDWEDRTALDYTDNDEITSHLQAAGAKPGPSSFGE